MQQNTPANRATHTHPQDRRRAASLKPMRRGDAPHSKALRAKLGNTLETTAPRRMSPHFGRRPLECGASPHRCLEAGQIADAARHATGVKRPQRVNDASLYRGLAALIAAAWLVGCSPVDDHAGHDHDHAGHDHAAHDDGHADEMCGEHGVPEAECGICQPDAVAHLKPGQSMKMRMPSPQSAEAAGITTTEPKVGPTADAIDCYAEIAFNQNRLARVSSPVDGIVREVIADLGAPVTEGQALARVWSASLAEAVAKAVLAHQTLEREQRLHAQRITPRAELERAEAEHRAACQPLRTLGFSEKQVSAMASGPEEPVLLDVRAPFPGEVIERQAALGELVETGQPLFTVADRSTMWAMLSIPETALPNVRIGQAVELRLDALPEKVFPGRLTWISAEVDERTRMARARAEIPDPGHDLRARMYARARILVGGTGSALLVPESSLQRIAGRPIVFVLLEEDLFEARVVALGPRSGGMVQVIEGLKAGERVVGSGTFAAKSQFLLSRLGAGCAHE